MHHQRRGRYRFQSQHRGPGPGSCPRFFGGQRQIRGNRNPFTVRVLGQFYQSFESQPSRSNYVNIIRPPLPGAGLLPNPNITPPLHLHPKHPWFLPVGFQNLPPPPTDLNSHLYSLPNFYSDINQFQYPRNEISADGLNFRPFPLLGNIGTLSSTTSISLPSESDQIFTQNFPIYELLVPPPPPPPPPLPEGLPPDSPLPSLPPECPSPITAPSPNLPGPSNLEEVDLAQITIPPSPKPKTRLNISGLQSTDGHKTFQWNLSEEVEADGTCESNRDPDPEEECTVAADKNTEKVDEDVDAEPLVNKAVLVQNQNREKNLRKDQDEKRTETENDG